MIRLGVNVDHVATLRQARLESYPDPVHAAIQAQIAGADNITCHLREDKRHMQYHDIRRLKETLSIPLNFEIAATDEMIEIACKIKPHTVTLVPEKRQELTTESGLIFTETSQNDLKDKVIHLKESGIGVALFIDLHPSDIEAASALGVLAVEFHTGPFCHKMRESISTQRSLQLVKELQEASAYAKKLGLQVHFGHGLNYTNAHWLQLIPEAEEANIGHAIVSQSIFVGFQRAVKDMKNLLNNPCYKPYIPE